MVKRVLIALALVVTFGIGFAAADGLVPDFFGSNYRWTAMSYGSDWKLVNVQTEQSTGKVLLFFQNTNTGEIAIHLHAGDTGFTGGLQCHDASTGIPVACVSGAIVN